MGEAASFVFQDTGLQWWSFWSTFHFVNIIRFMEIFFQITKIKNIYIFLGIFKKNKNFGFPYCSSCEDLSIYVAINYYCRTDIDEARVISALQHKSKFNLDVSWKENQDFEYLCCSTHEDLSIDESITTVGLILTKLRRFLFSGYRQTQFQNPHNYGNMSSHKKIQLEAQN